MDTIHHVYAPSLGGVRVKFETNSRGTNVEVSVDRPRTEGETFEEAAKAAVEIAEKARALAMRSLEPIPISIEVGK